MKNFMDKEWHQSFCELYLDTFGVNVHLVQCKYSKFPIYF